MTTGAGASWRRNTRQSRKVGTRISGDGSATPATLEDARGMLWTATLEDPDPALIFEHGCSQHGKGESAAGCASPWPFLMRRFADPGNRSSRSPMAEHFLKRSRSPMKLAGDGIDAEDRRSCARCGLGYRDDHRIGERTHRVLIIDEGRRSGGASSAEIMARIVENAFSTNSTRRWRVYAAPRCQCLPQAPQDARIPQVAKIVAARAGGDRS